MRKARSTAITYNPTREIVDHNVLNYVEEQSYIVDGQRIV
jgi:hypothetical protein